MRARLLASFLLLGAVQPAFAATQVTIVNNNAPNVGFNDPTPVAPVGGNAGTTLGEQRLIAFQHAAAIWGATLDSLVPVRVLSSFEPLACTATAATLGSAGAITVWSDFPNAPFADTWYGSALANKLSGADVDDTTNDIRARFNVNLGNAGCLTASGWYLGLDSVHGTKIDLVTVLLHEFAHGLGFQSFANGATGTLLLGSPDIYSKFYFDNTTQKQRLAMTDAERQASAVNPRKVVWTGAKVGADTPSALQLGTPLLVVSAPASVAGDYQIGAAAFGPALTAAGVSGLVVVALDPSNGAGTSTTDACSAITNNIAGKIALVDRGACGFAVKVKNAQLAGAIAVIVADNVAGGPPAGLGGTDATITIPSVRITLADGNALKAALTTSAITAALKLDLALRAGTDRDDRPMLFTPNPYQPGSSVSHWDTSAFPNQLMEPSINADLTHAVTAPADLTRSLLRDVGWYPDADLDLVADDAGDRCLASNLSSTVVIGGVDTGVSNTFFANGCTIADLLNVCKVDARNHGTYVSCGAAVTNALQTGGFITPGQKGTLQSAVARDK